MKRPTEVGMLRRTLERLSRGRVVRRRLPSDLGAGTVFLSPDATLSAWRTDYWKIAGAKQLADWAKRFISPGDIVYDVGANQGLFTYAASHFAGPGGLILAVEPDLFLANLMMRSSQGFSDVRAEICILPLAISDLPGVWDFVVAERSRAANHLRAVNGNSQAGKERHKGKVIGLRLDDMIDYLPSPKFVKIDVECAEAKVLEGATKVLREVRPRILVEVASENREDVRRILASHHYLVCRPEAPETPLSDRWPYNVLALPEEALGSIKEP